MNIKWKVFLLANLIFLASCGSHTSTIDNHILQSKITTPLSSLSFTLGGKGYEEAASLTVLPRESFLLGGSTTKSVGETTDFFLTRTNSLGVVEWFRTYGGSHLDYLGSVITSPEGGFLLWGETRSLFFTPLPGFDSDLKTLIVKVNENGVAEWSEEVRVVPTDLIQTRGGHYLLTGTNYSRGSADLFLAKISPDGKHLWQWTYRIPELNNYEGVTSITEIPDGGLLMLGSNSGNNKKWTLGSPMLIRLDSDGKLQRSRQFAGIIGKFNQTIPVEDGFIILGCIGAEDDILLVRIDREGSVLWAKSYGGRFNDKAFSLIENSSGLLVIGGVTRQSSSSTGDGMLLGVRKTGEIDYCFTIGNSWIRSIGEGQDGQVFVFGETTGMGPGLSDLFFTTWQNGDDGLWQSCKDEINVRPIDLRVSEVSLAADRVDIQAKFIPTETQNRPPGTGLHEAAFPVLTEEE